MIRSMTAFGNARAESDLGTISVDLRSVNNRYLDLTLRIPEEMRFVESALRERLTTRLQRGKVELRLSFTKKMQNQQQPLQAEFLQRIADDLALARSIIPDVPAPRLSELSSAHHQEATQADLDAWQALCIEAFDLALNELQASRQREGKRLADNMLEIAAEVDNIATRVETHMPQILIDQQQKISERLHEALMGISPEGFDLISGEELSARIAQEASLFSMRIDVAEELTRLRSHVKELDHILAAEATSDKKARAKAAVVNAWTFYSKR